MRYTLNGFSTPFGGISWEKCITEKDRIKYLFLYLESKRILVNPMSMEVVSECIASVLEIKSTLVEITKDISFANENLECIRKMLKGCNDFLNTVNEKDYPHLIYKNSDRWEDLRFDRAMKDFRMLFKSAILKLEAQTGILFSGSISDKW